MISNVSLATVFCLDQDAALDFWTTVMGFRKHTDAQLGENFRFVTVCHPDHPELEIALATPEYMQGEGGPEFVRRQLESGQMGGLGLRVDDCRKTHTELVAKGVEFVQEPQERPYGVEAIMRDVSGNWLVLVEPSD